MKSTAVIAGLLAAASSVSAHSTFQQLWVNGVDQAGTCVRVPPSNSPVTSVSSAVSFISYTTFFFSRVNSHSYSPQQDIRCGAGGARGVPGVCTVAAGGTVTVEMHQQPGQRSCSNEAIGGNHDGPVTVYLSKVNSATSDAGSSWFKIFQNGLVSSDYWGTDVLNANCGKQVVTIPSNIAPGDYLLRAEVIALHVAGKSSAL